MTRPKMLPGRGIRAASRSSQTYKATTYPSTTRCQDKTRADGIAMRHETPRRRVTKPRTDVKANSNSAPRPKPSVQGPIKRALSRCSWRPLAITTLIDYLVGGAELLFPATGVGEIDHYDFAA